MDLGPVGSGWRVWLAVAIAIAAAAACSDDPLHVASERDPVRIDSVALPGRLWDPFLPALDTGREVSIDGLLTVPAARRPVPAVVIEHGCGGPGSEREWVDVLAEHGIASIALDSFGARRVTAMHRFQDAYAGEPFAAHLACYPSTCFIRLADESDVTAPIRLFHGTADDYTPIDQCDEYVDRLVADGVDAAIFRYDGAHHAFDDRTLAWAVRLVSPSIPSPRACSFVERDGEIVDPDTGTVAGVGSPCVEFGVTSAYDPDARAAAERDLLDVLDEEVGT